MLCKCHWIVLYIVHFTAFCLGGPFLSGHGVVVVVSKSSALQHDNNRLFVLHSGNTKMKSLFKSCQV